MGYIPRIKCNLHRKLAYNTWMMVEKLMKANVTPFSIRGKKNLLKTVRLLSLTLVPENILAPFTKR